jgi:hypothetical protein
MCTRSTRTPSSSALDARSAATRISRCPGMRRQDRGAPPSRHRRPRPVDRPQPGRERGELHDLGRLCAAGALGADRSAAISPRSAIRLQNRPGGTIPAGRAYELPGEAPDWRELKGRAELAGRQLGQIPYGALMLIVALDVQDDYVDGVVVGFGRNLCRYVIARVRVEGTRLNPGNPRGAKPPGRVRMAHRLRHPAQGRSVRHRRQRLDR